jgi:hypothetical protein
MTCRDFERLCNELLDAREEGTPVERALEQHAASCPACQPIALRYQLLRRSIRALDPSPAPSAEALTRVLEQTRVFGPRPRVAFVGRSCWLVGFAVAAALVVASVLTLRITLNGRRAPETPQAPAPSPRPLADALADATSATWSLAQAASGPAARLGRQVIADASVPEPPSSLPLTDPIGPASDVLQKVSGRVNAGIRPLSGSARHAFGFLLGPALGADKPADRPGTGA